MSNEQERTGLCGWAAIAFFIVFLQGFLPLGMSGGMNSATISELISGHAGTANLLSRLLVIAGIVLCLLLSAVSAMILTLALASLIRLASRRMKNLFRSSLVPFLRKMADD